MTFYRSILLFFVTGNVILFTSFMRITSLPWDAALVFFGYVFANAPVLVSVFTAYKIDETLKGHWLNWLNISLPIATGMAGLLTYASLALHSDAHPVIFLFGPFLITMGWSVLFGALVMAYVFVASE